MSRTVIQRAVVAAFLLAVGGTAGADDRYPAVSQRVAWTMTPALARHVAKMSAKTSDTSCLPSPVRAQAAELVARFGGQVVSTFRRNAVVAGKGRPSMHRWCRAADVFVPARSYQAAFAWLSAHRIGGLGRYGWGFHVDDGGRRDWFGSAGRSRFGKAGRPQ